MKYLFSLFILLLLCDQGLVAQSSSTKEMQSKIRLLHYESLDKYLDTPAKFVQEQSVAEYIETFFASFSEDIIKEITGPVEIYFTILPRDGSVFQPILYSSLSDLQPMGFRAQAKMALREMPNWKPAMRSGEVVCSSHLIRIGIPQPVTVDNDPLIDAMDAMITDTPEPDEVFVVVENPPSFPGGEKAMKAYVKENIIDVMKAENPSLSGTIIVQFVVRKNGALSDIVVLRDVCTGCGEIAVEKVKQMPKWTPGRQRGRSVNVRFHLPLKFGK